MSLLVHVVLLCARTIMNARIKAASISSTTLPSLQWENGFTSQNSGVWGGGAVLLEDMTGAGAEIIDCWFISNWNGFNSEQTDESKLRGGGAICLKGAAGTCEKCRFQDCIAKSGWGGAIVSVGSTGLTIIDCEFIGCKCEHLEDVSENLKQFGGGGAICGLNTKTVVRQSHFTSCTCPCTRASEIHHGGAIMTNHSLACTDCTFTSTRTEKGNGGAIWVSGRADSTVSGCKFMTCVGKEAGGVYYTGEAPFEIADCRFERCSGQDATVACLYINTTALIFNNVTVLTNSATRSLVSLVIPTTVNIELVECHIDCTGSQGFESGHQCINFGESYGNISIRESSFVAVKKQAQGGGAFRFVGRGHTIEFLDCEFTGISASNNGGAITFANGHSEIVMIHGCRFDGCTAGERGGALHFSFDSNSAGTCDIQNCTFNANTAPGTEGKGQSLQLDFEATDPDPLKYVVRNCTFSKHKNNKCPLFFTPGQNWEQLQTPWELVELVFVENTVGDDGLVGIWSVTDMSYIQCEFTANECKNKGMVLLCKPKCGQRIFRGCVFQQCSGVGSSLMSVSTTTSLVDELILESCEFNGCSGTSLLTFSKIGNVTINGTTFDSCSFLGTAETSSMIVCSNQLQDQNVLFAIEDSHFVGCTGFAQLVSVEQSVISAFKAVGNEFSCDGITSVNIGKTTEQKGCADDVIFQWNNVTSESDGSTSLILQFNGDLEFSNNEFRLSQSTPAIQFLFPLAQKYTIEHCTFDNNNKKVTDVSKAFINLGSNLVTLHYLGCSFKNIHSDGAPAFYIPQRSNIWTVSMEQCNFTNLQGSDAGAVYGGTLDEMSLIYCCFEQCSSSSNTGTGVGAVFLSVSKSSVVRNCRFTECSGGSQSAHALRVTLRQTSSFDIGECIFEKHTNKDAPIIYLDRDATTGATLLAAQESYSLSDCDFRENKLGKSGVLKCDGAVGYLYENCNFSENTGDGLISITGSVDARIDLMHCRFETMKNELSSIFMAQGDQLSGFRLEGCYFSDITITDSMIEFSSVRFCSEMEISNCQFYGCKSESHQKSFLHISSETLNISGNNVFAFAPEIENVSPIKFELSGQGKIEGAKFSLLPWTAGWGYGKLVNLALSSSETELEFYNCCFTHEGFTLLSQAYPYFLVLSGQGKVRSTGACFDCPQEAAFTKEESVEVDFPAYSFETCECWVIPSFTDEPSQTDPQSSQVGPETTSDSESSSPLSPTTEDQSSGTGGKSNAGLIAGVTIAVIIIIVVIVIIVILLLRRRGQENSEEGVNSDEEFTEETITTVTQEKAVPAPSGDWSQTTEDNPIFGTESVDNSTNPFANAFEEDAW